MSDKKGLEEVRRWWKRLISSNPEGLEVRPMTLGLSEDSTSRYLGSLERATPKELGEPPSFRED